MDRRCGAVISLSVVLVMAMAAPGGVLAKGPPPGAGGGGGGSGGGGGAGGHEETAGKNLSFPAIAVDGFAISPITTPSFKVTYAGTNPGLTAEEITYLTANGPWYPQKMAANAWQADYLVQEAVGVTYVDWGDNVEAVNPRIGSPFRLEVVLYTALDTPMTAYTMAVLENPSSSTELQGTNTTTYQSSYATVVSSQPRLVVQYLGSTDPGTLTWAGESWVAGGAAPTIVPVSFAPELNVGGRHIYGASMGGWRPDLEGRYRITFFIPEGSGVALSDAQIGNYSNLFGTNASDSDEGGAATPVIVPGHNLSYVDVTTKSGRGGGGGGKGR